MCLKNRLYTKILRIHLFGIFTIKTPLARCARALVPLNRKDTDKCTLTYMSIISTHAELFTLYLKLATNETVRWSGFLQIEVKTEELINQNFQCSTLIPNVRYDKLGGVLFR